MLDIGGVNVPFLPIGGTKSLNNASNNKIQSTNSGVNFADFFNQELVKFSGNVQNAMVSQEMTLSDIDLLRLDEAIEKAKDKNARESLIILDNKMFVVSIDSKTVLSMFEKNNMDSSVITNIDSAVIA